MKLRRRVSVCLAVMLAFVLCGVVVQTAWSQPPAEPAGPAVNPPADQTYVGVKACTACHFKEWVAWKKTKHYTEAFQKLPAKYKTEASCLACHSTGFGAATGFKDEASTPNLAGTTCEACHGPGSAHVATAKPFANKKTLTAEETASVRGTTYKIMPGNICVRCHVDQGHKQHPAYDKE